LGAALHGADIDKLGIDRGHRILTILRKGGKIATIPLAPRTTRAIDLAVANLDDGITHLLGCQHRTSSTRAMSREEVRPWLTWTWSQT
jgi:hypothetical protein